MNEMQYLLADLIANRLGKMKIYIPFRAVLGIARHLIDNGVTMPWIDVELRLPPDGVIVLVSDGIQSDTAMYNAQEDYFDVDHAFVDPCNIDRWAPMPFCEGTAW